MSQIQAESPHPSKHDDVWLPLTPPIKVQSFIVEVDAQGHFTFDGEKSLTISVDQGQAVLRFILNQKGAAFVTTPVLWFDMQEGTPTSVPEPMAVQRTKKVVTLCDFNVGTAEEEHFSFRLTVMLADKRVLTSQDPTIINRKPSGDPPAEGAA